MKLLILTKQYMDWTNAIFLDSSFFKALLDENDSFHGKSVSLWNRAENDDKYFVTTNFILDEAYTVLRIKGSFSLPYKLRDLIADNPKRIWVERVTNSDEEKAWRWFENDWKKLSFTDCTCFSVMERLGLIEVATFDTHFEQAGYKLYE